MLQGPTIRRFQGGILNDGSGGERESDAAPGNCRSNGIQVTFHLIVGNNSMAGCRELKRLIDVAAAAQVTAMCTGPMTERNRCIAASSGHRAERPRWIEKRSLSCGRGCCQFESLPQVRTGFFGRGTHTGFPNLPMSGVRRPVDNLISRAA